MARKIAPWVMMLCATLVTGCVAEGQILPTAAEVRPVIQERGAVAQQYWATVRTFQRARLGFRLRFEVAVGSFSACSPGGTGGDGSGGLQYLIGATWVPIGVPLPEQGGLLSQAVPVIESALSHAGWSQFQPSTSGRLDVAATRHGITLSLDSDPANPAPLERNWTPAESYTVSGQCIPVTAQAAAEFSSVGAISFGTTRAQLPPVNVQTSD